jgi:hypothetical protein
VVLEWGGGNFGTVHYWVHLFFKKYVTDLSQLLAEPEIADLDVTLIQFNNNPTK